MKKNLLSLLVLIVSIQCYALTLGWNPNPDPTVRGYYLVYGLVSSNYTVTNTITGTNVNSYFISDTNFISNKIYYFNICAFNSNIVGGPYAGEISWTNTVNQIPPVTNIHFK